MIAAIFGLSAWTARFFLQRLDESGIISGRKYSGHSCPERKQGKL
ncbi:hypothetical protein [Faecousia sp.]